MAEDAAFQWASALFLIPKRTQTAGLNRSAECTRLLRLARIPFLLLFSPIFVLWLGREWATPHSITVTEISIAYLHGRVSDCVT